MRILLAAKHLHFPQGGGGLERNTHELCLRLLKRGVVPGVICNIQADGSVLSFRNRLARKLRPGVRYPLDRDLGYEVFRGWAEDDGAAEVVERFRPDVVIAQSAEPVPILKSFAGLGVPQMAYFHEVARVGDAGTIARMGEIGLLANSEFTARKMHEHGAWTHPPVVRPLIDRAFYETTPAPRNVLFVNTQPKKGLEVALQLAESRPDVRFEFVTNWVLGPQARQELARRARAAGNIVLHPPTNDMRPLYARARLLLAPSQCEEAWGRVATEAHISGVPVLASDRGGLPEAVGPGGLCIHHDAPIAAWRNTFSRIWDDPAEHARLSRAALAYSRRREIQPEAIVDTFVRAVESFLDQADRAPLRAAS